MRNMSLRTTCHCGGSLSNIRIYEFENKRKPTSERKRYVDFRARRAVCKDCNRTYWQSVYHRHRKKIR